LWTVDVGLRRRWRSKPRLGFDVEPIQTLLDYAVSPDEPILPAELRRYYDGALRFSTALEEHPYAYCTSITSFRTLALGRGDIPRTPGRERFVARPRRVICLRYSELYQYDFNPGDVADVWRRGSVVASWLPGLTAIA
jgi:hypothetical protein